MDDEATLAILYQYQQKSANLDKVNLSDLREELHSYGFQTIWHMINLTITKNLGSYLLFLLLNSLSSLIHPSLPVETLKSMISFFSQQIGLQYPQYIKCSISRIIAIALFHSYQVGNSSDLLSFLASMPEDIQIDIIFELTDAISKAFDVPPFVPVISDLVSNVLPSLYTSILKSFFSNPSAESIETIQFYCNTFQDPVLQSLKLPISLIDRIKSTLNTFLPNFQQSWNESKLQANRDHLIEFVFTVKSFITVADLLPIVDFLFSHSESRLCQLLASLATKFHEEMLTDSVSNFIKNSLLSLSFQSQLSEIDAVLSALYFLKDRKITQYIPEIIRRQLFAIEHESDFESLFDNVIEGLAYQASIDPMPSFMEVENCLKSPNSTEQFLIAAKYLNYFYKLNVYELEAEADQESSQFYGAALSNFVQSPFPESDLIAQEACKALKMLSKSPFSSPDIARAVFNLCLKKFPNIEGITEVALLYNFTIEDIPSDANINPETVENLVEIAPKENVSSLAAQMIEIGNLKVGASLFIGLAKAGFEPSSALIMELLEKGMFLDALKISQGNAELCIDVIEKFAENVEKEDLEDFEEEMIRIAKERTNFSLTDCALKFISIAGEVTTGVAEGISSLFLEHKIRKNDLSNDSIGFLLEILGRVLSEEGATLTIVSNLVTSVSEYLSEVLSSVPNDFLEKIFEWYLKNSAKSCGVLFWNLFRADRDRYFGIFKGCLENCVEPEGLLEYLHSGPESCISDEMRLKEYESRLFRVSKTYRYFSQFL